MITVILLAVLTGPYLHLDNWRFLWNPDIADTLKGASGVGAKFPSVWTAFGNSLFLALMQMTIVVTVATLAGYYLSRFDFRGRSGYMKGLLVLHAFPAMTLIIPIFLIIYWIGLLDTLAGVILVIAALELPFAIFVMKGFFDAVALGHRDERHDRRCLAPPGVPHGRCCPRSGSACWRSASSPFLRGWEEYVFVRTLLIQKSNWTMSLYLFWMREDVMGHRLRHGLGDGRLLRALRASSLRVHAEVPHPDDHRRDQGLHRMAVIELKGISKR